MQYKYSYIELWQPKNIKVRFRMYQLNLGITQADTYLEYWNNMKTISLKIDNKKGNTISI